MDSLLDEGNIESKKEIDLKKISFFVFDVSKEIEVIPQMAMNFIAIIISVLVRHLTRLLIFGPRNTVWMTLVVPYSIGIAGSTFLKNYLIYVYVW